MYEDLIVKPLTTYDNDGSISIFGKSTTSIPQNKTVYI